MSAADLDQGGDWTQSDKIYFGPTMGFINVYKIPITVGGPITVSVDAFLPQQPSINIGPILCDTTLGIVTVNLPPATGRLGFSIPVFDIGGAAFTNNIVIVPDGIETIMGLASISITTNYGSYVLEPIPTGGWYTP